MHVADPRLLCRRALETAFLAKKIVAVVGASADRSKFGNRIVRALIKARPDVTVLPGG